MSSRLVAIATISTFIFFNQLASAQSESSSGRMADGRAFRTDSQGVVMVDYIAELELETDSLRRQVQGLESELEEFRANSGSYNQRAENIKPISCPQRECPLVTCPEKVCPAPNICPVVNSESKNCQQEALVISQLEAQIQQLGSSQRELSDKLNLTSHQLNATKQREESLIAQNQILQKDLTSRRASLNINKLLDPETARPVQAPLLPAKRLEDSRNTFLSQARSELLSKVENLQSLIAKRDSRYQTFKANYSGAVTFTPEKVEFNGSQKISEVKASIASESSMRRLSDYAKQTNLLLDKVSFEIGMMDRLQSAKGLGQ